MLSSNSLTNTSIISVFQTRVQELPSVPPAGIFFWAAFLNVRVNKIIIIIIMGVTQTNVNFFFAVLYCGGVL